VLGFEPREDSMANPRSTFEKRRREQDKKDKARAKQERLAARRSEPRAAKGPEIAWDEAPPPPGSDAAADAPDTPEDVPSPE
jgi:hypothetical protein